MADYASEVPDFLRDKRQIAETDDFPFSCHPGVPCFNHCCADINIVLTPVDVLRLARRLGITTTDFLDQYCLHPITKELSLPVVVLRMGDDPAKKCQFVGEEGCTVYEDRPWSCRMYPVGMAIPPARAGVDPKPIFFLFEDDFCEGRRESPRWTVSSVRFRIELSPTLRAGAGAGGADPERRRGTASLCLSLAPLRPLRRTHGDGA